jgi:N-6 DNA Methylase
VEGGRRTSGDVARTPRDGQRAGRRNGPSTRPFLAGLPAVAAATGSTPAQVLAALARHLGATGDLRLLVAGADPPPALAAAVVPPPGAGPGLLGAAHEALLPPAGRRATGAHYTPAPLAAGLAGLAVDGATWPSVCDPAVGGGALLLAAADRLAAAHPGRSRAEVVGRLWGADVDGLAVAVADASLWLWSGGLADPAGLAERLVAGDPLADGLAAWPAPPPAGFACVVGNPPFLGQLARATVRDRGAAARLRDRLGPAAAGYADTSALFLVAACRLAADGGTAALLQPESVLGARDAGRARAAVLEAAGLRGLWLAGDRAVPASVRVCAPVLRVGERDRAPVRRWTGPELEPAPPAAHPPSGPGGWGPLVADLLGVPDADVESSGTLADLATATAGFRDEFYGLARFVAEAADLGERAAPLVTCGLVDPAACAWGRRPARFAGRVWAAPAVDPAAVDADAGAGPGAARLAAWLRARLAPKLVVATQTRVVEAAVDEAGRWVPSTPLIAVAVDPADRWLALAALLAPPVSAWALRAAAGTARSRGAVKLSARQVLAVPLPADRAAWEDGALAARMAATGPAEARRSHLLAVGEAMVAAYRVRTPAPLLSWWAARLP